MPKSGSTFTASKLSEITSIRTEHLVPLNDSYGVVEAEIDMGMLAKAMSQNRNSSFVAQHHVFCSDLIAQLIKKKYLVPLVLTRNLPDAIISLC